MLFNGSYTKKLRLSNFEISWTFLSIDQVTHGLIFFFSYLFPSLQTQWLKIIDKNPLSMLKLIGEINFRDQKLKNRKNIILINERECVFNYLSSQYESMAINIRIIFF